eukprot:TRINITY_DN12265_c0_g1_i1.p1 TRINITY_DN12265_c0_g1~~TRINITY_DN12265_c0_g1_i1.p1  ORF type:complete len:1104 (+),score=109.56 TRINITY_DN12265_c0_g1_i1:93-3404(+)
MKPNNSSPSKLGTHVTSFPHSVSHGNGYQIRGRKPLSLLSIRARHLCTGVLITSILQICILKFWLSPHQTPQSQRIQGRHVLNTPASLQWARTLSTAVYPRGQYGPEEGLTPRLLIVHVQHGLSNRLRAMLWGRALAEATARRYIVIWELDIHCNAKYEDLLQHPLIDPFQVWDSLPPDLLYNSDFDVYNYMEPEPGAKKYEYIDMDSPRDIYVRTAYALNCTSDVRAEVQIPSMFASLNPSEAVRAMAQRPAAMIAFQDYFGVHVRHTNAMQDIDSRLPKQVYTDKVWSVLKDVRALAKPSTFILECKRILAQSPDLKVFVAADMEETADEFVRELGPAVFYIHKPGCTSGVRSKQCVQFALADILMLSNSRFLLGSYWSSFTEVASYARQLAVHYAGIDFFGPYANAPLTCSHEDWIHPDAFHGVTIFNAVRSRNEMLARNLPSWLNVTGVDEILILDWDSSPPVEEITKPLNSNKIKVVRVTNTSTTFWLTVAYNLAAIHARGELIMKVDSDLELPTDLITRHAYLPAGRFYAGNWRTAPTEEESHLNGFIFVHRADFHRVNGYDERIFHYGYDDEDLYARLEAAGVARIDANLTGVKHVPHGDNSRRTNSGLSMDPHASTLLNNLLLEQVPRWSIDNSRTRLACNQTSFWSCDCALVKAPTVLQDLVSAETIKHVTRTVKQVEVRRMTNWTWDMMLSVNSEEWLDHHFSLIGPFVSRALIVQPLGCLADRIRAIELMRGLGMHWGRPLTVVWVPDQFCTTPIENVLGAFDGFQVIGVFNSWEADPSIFELVDTVRNMRSRLPSTPKKEKHMLVRIAGGRAINALSSDLSEIPHAPLTTVQGLNLQPVPCPDYPVLKAQLDGGPGTQLSGLTDLWALSEALNRPLVITHSRPSSPFINEFVVSPFEHIEAGNELSSDASGREIRFRDINVREIYDFVPSAEHLSFRYADGLPTPSLLRESAARIAQGLVLTQAGNRELTKLGYMNFKYSLMLSPGRPWESIKGCFERKLAEIGLDPLLPILVVTEANEYCEGLPSIFGCLVVPPECPTGAWAECRARSFVVWFYLADMKRIFWSNWTDEVEWVVLRSGMPNHQVACNLTV